MTSITTCAYCGVGCGFKAEMKGNEVVRMTPWKDGKANEGHACVKGRFAWGYATHKDRITKPMIRAKTTDPWREVSWEEAFDYAASEFQRVQEKYGKNSVGALVSSRCTNEEDYLVQKLVRAAFGNNNVDTCARVCHRRPATASARRWAPRRARRRSSRWKKPMCILLIGSNPTEGHPVVGSRLKRRVREGAKLIVIDPREIDMVTAPHARATHHLKLRPGTNVAMLSALAHVIVTEGLVNETIHRRTLRDAGLCRLARVRRASGQFARSDGSRHRRARRRGARGGASVCHRRQRGHLLRSRRDRTFAGLDRGDRHRQPRDGDRQRRARRRGRESAARAEQRAGLLRHGRLPAYSARLPPCVRHGHARTVRESMGCEPAARAGPAHSQHAGSRAGRFVQGTLLPGRRPGAVRPQHAACAGRAGRDGMRGGAGPVPQRDGEVRACVPARCFLPGKGRHLHQRRTPHLARAQGHAAAGGQGRLGSDAGAGRCARLPDALRAPVADHGRDRAPDADLYRSQLRQAGTAWAACNGRATTRRRKARR